MGTEGTALIDAIYDEAAATSDLMADVAQSGDIAKGFYYETADPDATMPYIVYKVVDKILNHNFSDYYVSSIVYFNIYDGNSSIATITSIKDKLTIAFDRTVLTYAGKTAVGCLRSNDGDPQWLDDGWMCTVIYDISYS